MIITPTQFNAAYTKLPFPIRQYLAGDDIGKVAQQVGAGHALHIDTIGALEREISNMLLGLINPTQFVGELKSIGIPEASIGAIVEELNTKVFIPLREKMKNPPIETEDEDDQEFEETPVQNVVAPPVSAPVTQAPPIPPPIVHSPASVPTPAPVVMPSRVTAPVQVPAPARAPVASAPAYMTPPPIEMPSVSAFTTSTPTLTAIPTPSATPANFIPPHVRTMQEDMRTSKQSPHTDAPVLTAPVRPPAYSQVPTAQAPSPSASPAMAPTPRPSQSVQPPTQVPQSSAPMMPVQKPPQVNPPPLKSSENRDALHAILKEYGVDPYREPAE